MQDNIIIQKMNVTNSQGPQIIPKMNVVDSKGPQIIQKMNVLHSQGSPRESATDRRGTILHIIPNGILHSHMTPTGNIFLFSSL